MKIKICSVQDFLDGTTHRRWSWENYQKERALSRRRVLKRFITEIGATGVKATVDRIAKEQGEDL